LFLLVAFAFMASSSIELKTGWKVGVGMQSGPSNAATAPAQNLSAARTPTSAEERLKELGIQLPSPPQPFGTYTEAVRTGNLLFLSGMLPTEGHAAKFIGRIGSEFDVDTGRRAARLAALNGLAVARESLGSLDKITRIVRLGVSLATTEDCREHPKVADGASDLLQDVFGKDKNPSRLIIGVASLPLGTPVALELIFEVA
jgi:enamine deaminase RidA (YjgF/YER057c/UK114 family)